MHEHWLNKRKRSQGMSNEFLDKFMMQLYQWSIRWEISWCWRRWLFDVLFRRKKSFERRNEKFGLQEMKFKFDFNGVQPYLINEYCNFMWRKRYKTFI